MLTPLSTALIYRQYFKNGGIVLSVRYRTVENDCQRLNDGWSNIAISPTTATAGPFPLSQACPSWRIKPKTYFFCNQESDTRFYVVKEGKPTDVPADGATGDSDSSQLRPLMPPCKLVDIIFKERRGSR